MAEQSELINTNNCERCCEEDNDRMVQCDKCDLWYHFHCVGVDSAIADTSWSCDGCNSSTSAEKNVSNKDPARNNQVEETSVNLLMPPQATSSPTINGEAQQKASKNTEGIIKNNQPSTDVPGLSSKFVKNVPKARVNTALDKNNAQVINTQQTKVSTFSKVAKTSAPAERMSFPFAKNQQQLTQKQQNEPFNAQCELQLKMLEEQQRIQQEFLEKKYQILSQLGQNDASHHTACNNMT